VLLIVFFGAMASRLSSSVTVEKLLLSRGEATTLRVFRIFPDTVRLSLRFSRGQGENRSELGEYASKTFPGYLEFASPGEAVVLLVRAPTSAAEYEALPAGGYATDSIGRNLVVRDSDGDPRRFAWPPDNALISKLPVGLSEVEITVLETGPGLAGEEVSVTLGPPLSLKHAMPGYGFLWWFLLWPLYAVLLTPYAAILAWKTFKSVSPR
jgi:hypothetical protein